MVIKINEKCDICVPVEEILYGDLFIDEKGDLYVKPYLTDLERSIRYRYYIPAISIRDGVPHLFDRKQLVHPIDKLTIN